MADDLFGMLYGNLDPKKQLLTAVSCSMIDSVCDIIKQKSLDVNSILMLQNGNTALHIAAQKGSYHIVKVLLDAQANPDVANSFGLSPLSMALRNGQEKCVKLLLETGGELSDPMLVWKSTQMDCLSTWIGYSCDVLEILLISTPDFSLTGKSAVNKMYHTFLQTVQSVSLVKMFFLTGNRLQKNLSDSLIRQIENSANIPNPELCGWVKGHCSKVHTLQHSSRVAIRRHLKPNVYYGRNLLPIPARLQSYLVFEDLSRDCFISYKED